jgi:hypothetical protein
MAIVDPDNDGIQRNVVRRYAHDPLRHERRHQVVAAFDSEQEFRRLLETLAGDLKRRRDSGDAIDPLEHYTGLRLESDTGDASGTGTCWPWLLQLARKRSTLVGTGCLASPTRA